MIKVILIVAFALTLLLLALLNGAEEVPVRYWLFSDPVRLPLGLALFLFAIAGALVAAVIALFDRASLGAEKRRLEKRLRHSEKEVQELRQIMTTERDEP